MIRPPWIAPEPKTPGWLLRTWAGYLLAFAEQVSRLQEAADRAKRGEL